MDATRKKPPAQQDDARPTERDGAAPAVAPLMPVRPRIGETRGNLKAREEAFKRRHGVTTK